MTAAVKLIPLLLAWTGMVLVLARRFSGKGLAVAGWSIAGFCAGTAAGAAMLATLRGDLPYGIIKTVTGSLFLSFWGGAALSLYRATGGQRAPSSGERVHSGAALIVTVIAAGLLGGVVAVPRLLPQGGDGAIVPLLFLTVAAGTLAVAAVRAERLFPPSVTVTNGALLALIVSLLLFMSSFTLRLDLFSPLTMKVMKFIHDFIHQFFESMLIPDHPFFRADVWTWIGYLFGSGVGFWGGIIVWFAPALMTVLAIRLEPLPAVTHIRQGAKRRKLLASCISERRYRLIAPWTAVCILAAAVYQSRFPAVEYWDPQPVAVSANQAGQILIPRKGEIDLEDGKLHKYLFSLGGREARFFVMMTPSGKLAVTLDACAICKPEGYGQAEGSVICYYCKTLIPLETVGKPGGCNPVPVSFEEKGDGVSIDAATLLNRWGETVTATSRIEGQGK